MAKGATILGISCHYHDSAAVLVRDGEVVFAAHEERYTRKKHDPDFPRRAIAQALRFAGIEAKDIDVIGFYEKPLLKFERILRCAVDVWPRGLVPYHMAMREWMLKKLWIAQEFRKELPDFNGEILFVPHHESHAASSYFASGFPHAAVVSVDGVGEWATTTIGKGEGTNLELLEEIHYPHSLGLLYSALTYYLGFRVNSAEYKVMGLAPYGEPKYMDQMRELIKINDDGSFALNRKYFTYEYGLTMTGRAMEKLFGHPRRTQESKLEQFHKDVARSLQQVTEDAMMALVRHAKDVTGAENLCLAGGVALNCVANGKILRSNLFKDIFIQPASGDAGGALGVALDIWHKHCKGARTKKMEHAFLGNSYTDGEIEAAIRAEGLPFEKLGDADLIERAASLLAGENAEPRIVSNAAAGDSGSRVIGWFQGRMEYGPRSLGSRSIIADARNNENWQKVNLKIKFRESFRPFAPTVLEERCSDYFDLDRESPYMLLVADTLSHRRAEIPAVTHVDGSARIQTIRRSQNPRYYDLLKAFEKRTGCGVIINTSFNVRGEPIVESPRDAINCFLHTHMDYLVLGNYVLSKEKMPPTVKQKTEEYLKQFALD